MRKNSLDAFDVVFLFPKKRCGAFKLDYLMAFSCTALKHFIGHVKLGSYLIISYFYIKENTGSFLCSYKVQHSIFDSTSMILWFNAFIGYENFFSFFDLSVCFLSGQTVSFVSQGKKYNFFWILLLVSIYFRHKL